MQVLRGLPPASTHKMIATPTAQHGGLMLGVSRPVGDGVSLSMNEISPAFRRKQGSNRSELPFLDDVGPAVSRICIILPLA